LIIETITLTSDLVVTLLDQTRHYFGGYYHVKVRAYCDVSLERSYFDTDADFSAAVTIMGESVRFERVLEKMAVPECDIETVRSQLTQAFHATTTGYLSVFDFAPRYVRSEYQKRMKKSPHSRSQRA
jgi:hypothetical protein